MTPPPDPSESHDARHLLAALDQIKRQQFAMDQHSIVAMTDPAGTITYANKKFCDITGYSHDELIGQNHRLISSGHHPRAFFTEMYQTISSGHVWHGEICNRAKNGHLYWVSTTIVPFFELTGKLERYVAIRTDITALKEATDEKLLIDKKLAETAKLESLGVLAGGIAHDFNNLLTAILGNASLLRIGLSSASPELEYVGQIEQASRRAADLCKQMLAYSGKGRFVIQRINLNQVVQETTRLLEISISKHCVLRFHLATSLPFIEADATQMRQIVMNLIINASEAIGERSGVIAISTGVVRVDPEYIKTFIHQNGIKTGDYVSIEVSDNGCGMDATTFAKIFDPFFTTKFSGRGLGLAAVLGIVRGHKGAIKVYSEPNKGSTFKLLFPCSDSTDLTPPEDNPSLSTSWQGSGTALIIDDEESIRVVAARIFESMSFKVALACDGREGVELFRAHPDRFSIVLLDLTMPHLDGEETFRQLRHIQPGVRVILTSGFNHQEVITRFSGKGLSGFVQKPFDAVTLRDVVKQVCLTK